MLHYIMLSCALPYCDERKVYSLMLPAQIGLIVFAYLLGSIPFAAIITHWRLRQDIYEVGEGNVGARNVWHVVGPVWGVSAGVLDALKGWVCYIVCTQIVHAPLAVTLFAGVAVVLGHQFPLYTGLRGGKGLSTMGGFLIGYATLPALLALTVLALMFLITRDFNPSMVVAAIVLIFSPLLFHEPLQAGYALIFGLLAGFKKLLDRSHETEVWSRTPWQRTEAKPGFLSEEADENASLHQHSPEG
jgi:acyl phosphate:glycerol-3-phosphate acyltransferase